MLSILLFLSSSKAVPTLLSPNKISLSLSNDKYDDNVIASSVILSLTIPSVSGRFSEKDEFRNNSEMSTLHNALIAEKV